MTDIQSFRAPAKGSAAFPHAPNVGSTLTDRLARPPRARATRCLLEAADIGAELRALLAPALMRARKGRDRALANVLDAALLAAVDLSAEVDQAGMALMQLESARGLGGRGP